MAIIETRDLTKIYGSGDKETVALDALNLAVEDGEIFGFLGPNGAGKTTTIRLLLDLIRPTAGGATIFGKDVRENSVELHRQIGFLPGELNLWKNRTANQVIHYLASIRGDVAAQKQEAARIADRLKLDTSKKVREYSTGNKRKLGLVLALMHNPQLLILDEPTSGLDPLMQQTFNQMMLEYKDMGRTVFLSSHVLSEVQAICDRVGILRHGMLQAVQDVESLTHVEFRHVTVTVRDAAERVADRLRMVEGVQQVSTKNGHQVQLQLLGDFDPLMRALADDYIVDLQTQDPTLEEIFLTFYSDDADAPVVQAAARDAVPA